FQAEDGIRDFHVTGVQTCALPIFQLGWNVHTLAYVLMMLVIASGVYGMVVYATLPQALSDNRREMTKRQMVEALAAIDRQLEARSEERRVGKEGRARRAREA